MSFHDEFVKRFRFIGGHADVLGLFADGDFLVGAAAALAAPFEDAGVTKVAAVEARGFILGSAVAVHLGAGFVPIRKAGSIHPGPKAERPTPPDWRGRESVLRVQRAALRARDRVLLIDDWAETGSQAITARALIEDCGASYAGMSVLVDQLPPQVRERLTPFVSVVGHEELAGDGGADH
jgi:adenine phosphoribosyltransferase